MPTAATPRRWCGHRCVSRGQTFLRRIGCRVNSWSAAPRSTPRLIAVHAGWDNRCSTASGNSSTRKSFSSDRGLSMLRRLLLLFATAAVALGVVVWKADFFPEAAPVTVDPPAEPPATLVSSIGPPLYTPMVPSASAVPHRAEHGQT